MNEIYLLSIRKGIKGSSQYLEALIASNRYFELIKIGIRLEQAFKLTQVPPKKTRPRAEEYYIKQINIEDLLKNISKDTRFKADDKTMFMNQTMKMSVGELDLMIASGSPEMELSLVTILQHSEKNEEFGFVTIKGL